MIIPVIPLHILCLIKVLLRNITRAPSCNLTDVSKLVLVLNIGLESDRFHYIESIKSMN